MSNSRVPPDTDSGLLDWALAFSSYVQSHAAALEIAPATATELTTRFGA